MIFKKIKLFIILCLLFFVCGCVDPHDCLTDGHKWIAATYKEPQTCEYCHETEGEPLPLPEPIIIDDNLDKEISYYWGGKFGNSTKYTNYGIYKGYLVLLNAYASENNNPAYMIEDVIFKFIYDFDIYAYKNGKFINLIDCYKLGILSIDDIKIIGNYHKNYYKSLVDDKTIFDDMYDDTSTINEIYDKSDAEKLNYNNKLTSSEINELNNANGSDFKYSYYYGEFNKCRVFLQEFLGDENNFFLCNSAFRYKNNFKIIVYYDGKFLELPEAYTLGYLGSYEIEKISILHYKYVTKNENIVDYDQYELEYNDIWTLDYFYDEFGNKIDVIDKKRLGESSLSGLSYESSFYYGTYQGYEVFMAISNYPAEQKINIGDVTFKYPYYFSIVCYGNDTVNMLEDLYNDQVFNQQMIINILFYHKINLTNQLYVDDRYLEWIDYHNK